MQKQPPTKKSLKPLAETAMAILARREHSTVELRRKLATKGYPLPEIMELIRQFSERDYLNDARYAAARARTRAEGSKWGAGRIRQELSQQGVAKDTTTQTMAELDETQDWLATAHKLLQRKFPKPLVMAEVADPKLGRAEAFKEFQKEKSRRISFLTRRGFSLSQSLQALGLQSAEDDDTDYTPLPDPFR